MSQPGIDALHSEPVIREIIQALHSTLDLDDIFDNIVQALGICLQADRCFISRFDDTLKVLSPPSREYRSSSSVESIIEADAVLWTNLCRFAERLCHEESRPVILDDSDQQLSDEARAILAQLQVRSSIGIIIRFQEECLAVLFVQQTQRPREWTQPEKDLIGIVAKQASIAIHHARLYKQLQTLAKSRHGISELYRKAILGHGMNELFDTALHLVCTTLNVRFCKVIEQTEDPECSLVIRAVLGFDPSLTNRCFNTGEEPHSAYTLQVTQPVVVTDIYTETRFQPSPLHFEYQLTSGVSAVIYSDQSAFGVLEADSQEKRIFSNEDVMFMQTMANVLGLIMERKRVEALARQASERFRILVENVMDYAIYLENVDGIIESWNPGAERIYGYTPQEVLGQYFSLFLEEELAQSDFCKHELQVASTEGRFETEGWRIRKDGSRFWANVVLEALRDQDGTLIGFTNITRDMTERRQAEQERLEYQHQLEQSNKSLEIFAAMASHDLKAPLRKIGFFSDHIYMTAKEKLDEESLEDLLRIRKSVHHMQSLVDDFLILARVSKRDHDNFQPVDLFTVAHKVVGEYAEQIREKHATVDIGPLLTIQGDAGQLEQLFHNLIGNALKFQKPDSSPHITIASNHSESGGCEIRITDNGIGFSTEHAERIFEPLERLHASSQYDGTGVGLTICKRIVEQHGGAIRADGMPGEGATFILQFPCQ